MSQDSETKNSPGSFETPSVEGSDDSLYLSNSVELGLNPEQNGDGWPMTIKVTDLGNSSQIEFMQWNGFKNAVKKRLIKEGQGQAYFVRGKLACPKEIPIGVLYLILDKFEKPKGVTRVAWKSR